VAPLKLRPLLADSSSVTAERPGPEGAKSGEHLRDAGGIAGAHWMRNARISAIAQASAILLMILYTQLPGHEPFPHRTLYGLLAAGVVLGLSSALAPWQRLFKKKGSGERRFMVWRVVWHLVATGLLAAAVAVTGGDLSPIVIVLVQSQAVPKFGSFSMPIKGLRTLLLLTPSLALVAAEVVGSRPLRPALMVLEVGIVLTVASLLAAFEGELGHVVGELRLLHQREAYRARHDTLSACANRAGFFERLEAELAERPLALAYLDLDDFKSVNDELGHEAGDKVLEAVGDRLVTSVRAEDLAARLGGDEFAVILGGCSDPTGVVERLRAVCAVPIDLGGRRYVPSVSVGVVEARQGEDVQSVLQRADAAMYADKRRRSASSHEPGRAHLFAHPPLWC